MESIPPQTLIRIDNRPLFQDQITGRWFVLLGSVVPFTTPETHAFLAAADETTKQAAAYFFGEQLHAAGYTALDVCIIEGEFVICCWLTPRYLTIIQGYEMPE